MGAVSDNDGSVTKDHGASTNSVDDVIECSNKQGAGVGRKLQEACSLSVAVMRPAPAALLPQAVPYCKGASCAKASHAVRPSHGL